LATALCAGFAAASAAQSPAKDNPAGKALGAPLLAKQYVGSSPREFDARYKGKTVVVEGRVEELDGTRLILRGYDIGFPSTPVRCEAYGCEFKGVQVGEFVRVRGRCKGYQKWVTAVDLGDCKLLKSWAAVPDALTLPASVSGAGVPRVTSTDSTAAGIRTAPAPVYSISRAVRGQAAWQAAG
jgi:hypothetical protein